MEDLPLLERQAVKDGLDPVGDVVHPHPELEVVDRSADVLGDEACDVSHGRREAANAQVQIDDDDGDLDTGEDIGEIVGDFVQLLIPTAELIVDRAELLVGALQLLLGALQLLVGALQLLVGRDQLLVGRGEVVAARLLLG